MTWEPAYAIVLATSMTITALFQLWMAFEKKPRLKNALYFLARWTVCKAIRHWWAPESPSRLRCLICNHTIELLPEARIMKKR